MGCSASKLDDGEAIQLCRDRKNFIKQAVEQRLRFATGHTAYVDSLRRVSVALRNYMEGGGGEHLDLYSDSCSTPPFTPPVKRYSPEIMRIPPKPSSSPKPIQYRTHQATLHYLRSGGGNSMPAVTIEETPVRVVNSSAYHYPASTTEHYFGVPSLSASPPPPTPTQNYYSLPSPQNSQWDFFWNPFSSLENYGYSDTMEVVGHGDHMTGDDDVAGLRRVREEEGIPDLEDEYEEEQRQQEQMQWRQQQEQQQQFRHQQQQQWRQQQEQQQLQQQQWRQQQEQQQLQQQQWRQQQEQQQLQLQQRQQQQLELKQKQWQWRQQQQKQQQQKQQQQKQLNLQESTKSTKDSAGINMNNNTESQMKKFQSHEAEIDEPTKNKSDFEIDLRRDKEIARSNNGGDHQEATAVEETSSSTTNTPGFTVYINRRPGSMSEVMRDIETQFARICDSSQEISMMLEASRAHYTSTASNELTAIRMLNPVALFRTASLRSTSSRFMVVSSCSKDDNYETGSEFSEESSASCMLSGSHHSTLDRLYAWEKKLYEEVKSGERIRIAYEKKCMQLRSQDVTGDDPRLVDKTRKAVRDLHTRIKISIHSIESISRRIEKLRDEELHPQLVELLQGLSRMWRTMADCHRIQKRAIDEAKLLLATPKLSGPPPPLIRLAHFASNLELELRNWRSCLETWITAHRAYIRALAGWLLRCSPTSDPSIVRPVRSFSSVSPPRSSGGAPPIFDVCIQWSRLLDSVSEAQAVDGLDFFAAGIASVVGQQREHALAMKRAAASGKEDFEEDDGVVMSAEKIAEVAVKVVCAGMSVAVSLLSEFAFCSMEGCEEVVRRSENGGKEETREDQEEECV